MSQIKISDGLACWARGDTVVILWKSDALLHNVSWLYDQFAEASAASPDGILVLQLVLATANPPNGPAREENHRRAREAGKSLKRVVTVAIGGALRVIIVRAIMRTIALISGHSKTQFVASTEAEGIDKLLELTSPTTPSKRQIVMAIGDLFRALEVPHNEPIVHEA